MRDDGLKNIKRSVLLLILSVFSSSSYAEDLDQTKAQALHHPVWPMLAGAGLITWGAYGLGDDSKEGQRNVKILWGTALLASLGLVLYQSGQNKMNSTVISVQPAGDAPAIMFSYNFL